MAIKMSGTTHRISIILPAKNEAENLKSVLPNLCVLYQESEIIVIDDGSTDDTVKVCAEFDVKVHSHPYSMGNGAAIKSGARLAGGDVLVFMDADGQHDPADIGKLVDTLESGYDMVVGARSREGQQGFGRYLANAIYNRLASWMVGQQVLDLTSGFRVVRAERFREFLYMLPNGFSYPTTSTMAFFRAGYPVGYKPISVRSRGGKSHINIIRDGVRFLLIIFRVGTLYSPLKLFFPVSLFYLLLGLGYYSYTYITEARFTNMSVLLITSAVFVFLIGLISEQITTLLYSRRDNGS